jgi:biotin carboxylase
MHETDVKFLLIIDLFTDSIALSVRALRAEPRFANLGMLVLSQQAAKYADYETGDVPFQALQCDFDDAVGLAAVLEPFAGSICGVVCRGDKRVQYLRRVIPFLSKEVLVATPRALQSATNKRLMRADFLQHYPEITPQFLEIYDATSVTIRRIEQKLSYPVIVKPANLVSSLLIQSCHSRTELETVMAEIFDKIEATYRREERHDQPQVIVEEYLEGDFYSIDAYVMGPGEVYYCPPVGYIPAKQLGIDDFFLYKRFVPTGLSRSEVVAANETVSKALTAVGLTHSSAHVELVLTKHGWKIIEIGPRLGRFRRTMYELGYGIDHSLNDIKIHLGIKPDIPHELMRHCSAYSIYPSREGVLRAIKGLQELENNRYVVGLNVTARPGDLCRFAKNGGHSLAEFVVASKNSTVFKKLSQTIETEVYADVDEQ